MVSKYFIGFIVSFINIASFIFRAKFIERLCLFRMNNSENNDNFPKNTEYFFNLRISDIFADTETELPRVKEQEGFDIHEKLKELTFDDLVGLILRLNNCGEMEEEGRRSQSEAWNLVTVARWVVHCIVLLYCNCIVVG